MSTTAIMPAYADPHERVAMDHEGPPPKRIVTGYGFWIFLLSDIVMFSCFFASYAVLVNDDPDDEDESLRSRSDWVLVSRDPAALEAEPIVEGGGREAEDQPGWRTWTDDYSNLIQILK